MPSILYMDDLPLHCWASVLFCAET